MFDPAGPRLAKPAPSEPTTGADRDELRITKRLLENMTVRCEAAEQREREAGAAVGALVRMLETATVRLEILLGRMAACETQTHCVSKIEVPGWIEEQRAALAAVRCGPAQPIDLGFERDVDGDEIWPAPVSDPAKDPAKVAGLADPVADQEGNEPWITSHAFVPSTVTYAGGVKAETCQHIFRNRLTARVCHWERQDHVRVPVADPGGA